MRKWANKSAKWTRYFAGDFCRFSSLWLNALNVVDLPECGQALDKDSRKRPRHSLLCVLVPSWIEPDVQILGCFLVEAGKCDFAQVLEIAGGSAKELTVELNKLSPR